MLRQEIGFCLLAEKIGEGGGEKTNTPICQRVHAHGYVRFFSNQFGKVL